MSPERRVVDAIEEVTSQLSQLLDAWWTLSEESEEMLNGLDWGQVLPVSLDEAVLAWSELAGRVESLYFPQ